MDYADMTRGVLSRAKGCPEAEAVSAMRDACMEFCTRTYALTTAVTRVLTGPATKLAGFTHQVVDIVEARIAGEPVLVTFANDPAVDELCPGQYAITFQDPSYLTLTPAPSAAAPVTLDLLLVIAPGPDSTEVDDVLWLRHSEALKHGALARVLTGPGPWMSLPSAAYHELKFEAAMKAAAADYGKNRRTVARRLRVLPA